MNQPDLTASQLPVIAQPSFVEWIRSVAPYIHQFRGQTFVVAVGGEIIQAGVLDRLAYDLALLNALGIQLILVHGIRPQVSAQLASAGIPAQFAQNTRITDAAALESVKACVGTVRLEIEAAFSQNLPNTPMHGAQVRVISGNFITARPVGIIDGIDFQYTGFVSKIDIESINNALTENAIVLISPLGFSPTGEMFNLSHHTTATEVATAVKADKLIFLTEQQGFPQSEHNIPVEYDRHQLENFLQSNGLSPEAQTLCLCAQQALQAGIQRVHLLPFHLDGAILQEIFTHNGAGTIIVSDSLNNIRPATLNDVNAIAALIQPLENNGTLIRRGRANIEKDITHFYVAEHDHRIFACAALYVYNDEKMAELACLTVDPLWQGSGEAEKMLRFIEKAALHAQVEHLFVLTTRTAHWFLKQGFTAASISDLPQKKQAVYDTQRNSKVLTRKVTSAE